MKSFHFTRLNLPPQQLQLRTVSAADDGGEERYEVFDPLRRKWLCLTDEEWVRQHFTAYMTSALGYPASVMANEVGLKLNRTQRRVDTVVYGRHGEPLMIVEYKAPSVAVTQETFDQIVRYNMVLRARYLAVSNGLVHYCCAIDYECGTYTFLRQMPAYADIANATKQ